MHGAPLISESAPDASADWNMAYLWRIAVVAALGGLLFGFDWVVIGGAKPFYEAYFRLDSVHLVGWANSCALVGCISGSFLAGFASDFYGRRRCLILAAALFTISALFTGLAHSFAAFVFWRIVGGCAIGIASNVSPVYIAEISPAATRGRFVSLNQFLIVAGILLAQLVNWCVARPVPEDATEDFIRQSWNGIYGWRIMFAAVGVPAILFFVCAFFIPESPRWLFVRRQEEAARKVLARIGGPSYALEQTVRITASLRKEAVEKVQWTELFAVRHRRVLLIGSALALLQQWIGINVIFNYAEEVYKSAGYGVSTILFNIVITGAINLIFTLLAMVWVDRLGRRTLMLWGCGAIAAAHLLASYAYRHRLQGLPILILTLCAIAAYAASLAPVVWVLISEIFPNRIRGLGVSVAVSVLWLASFALTYTFPIMDRAFGTASVFAGFGTIALLGFFFVFVFVPETRGRSLESISEGIEGAS